MQKETDIEGVTKIGYHCDDCKKGVFRLIHDVPIDSSPKQWKHECSNCGREGYFTVVFPIIRYKGKEFMLADSQRFEPSKWR